MRWNSEQLATPQVFVFLCLGVILIAGLASDAGFNRSVDGQHGPQTTSQTTEEEKAERKTEAVTLESFGAPKPNPTPDRAEYREEEDLTAQRAMALWTGVMGVVSILGLVLSACAVALLWITLTATRDMIVATREIGVGQSAAYAHVISAEVKHTPNNPFVDFRAKIIVKNDGATPAKNVRVCALMQAESIIDSVDAHRRPKINEFFGILPTLPKGEERGVAVRITDEARSALRNISTTANVHLRGFIRYDDVFGNTYESDFSFWIGHTPPYDAALYHGDDAPLFVKVKSAEEKM
ncbi:MAG: hypothetical protein AAFX86_00460 [Pseudomonadota bacterium]